MKHRKAAIAASVILLAAALTGCAAQYTSSGNGVNSIDVDLPDGGTVTCIVTTKGGVDCDWEGAR